MSVYVDWKSLSLFHVVYPRGDLVGKLLACCSMIPIVLLVMLLTVVLLRRDLHTIAFVSGLVLNECVNNMLKVFIKQSRPMYNKTQSTYGMPSSHAQFVGFFSVYALLFIYYRLNSRHWGSMWRAPLAVVCVLISLLVCYSRIYLLYHYATQVFVGWTLGSIFGTLWFSFVHLILTPSFPRICDSYLGQILMLQDFTHVPNILLFEYNTVKRLRCPHTSSE